MKRTLFILLLLLPAWAAMAQISIAISGKVTDLATGVPVPNHAVYAFSGDSTTAWVTGTGMTDANGLYNIVLVLPPGNGYAVVHTGKGCTYPSEEEYRQISMANGDTQFTVDFLVCAFSPPPPPPPLFCFVNAYDLPLSGLSVQFYSYYTAIDSNSNAVSWAWDFGDGTSGTGQNPAHTYAAPGIYTATVLVAGSNGCNAVAEITVYVSGQPPVQYCQGYINFVPIDSLTFQFTGTYTSQDSTSTTAVYQWNFGDNTSSTLQNPVHTYQNSGFYTVTLVVTGSNGCIDTATFALFTNFPPFPQCAVSITYAQTDSTTYSFSASGFGPNGDSTALWIYNWDFGDGTTSTSAHPAHTYAHPGFYTVKLVSMTSDSCQSVATIVLSNYNTPVDTFWYGCQALFGATPGGNPAPDPFTVTFTDWSIGGVQTWSWNFGDSTSGNLQNPIHTYPQPGFYTVYLVITTFSGCQSTAVYTIYVGPVSPWGAPGVCQALFLPEPDSLGGNGIQFFDLSISLTPIQTWTWDFGDGSTDNEQNPYHVYAQPGVYTVSLTITGDSCNSVISFTFNSLKPWNYNQKPGLLGQAANFTATHDIPSLNGFRAFPNPVTDVLHIAFQSTAEEDVSLRVHDLSGRLCSNQSRHVQPGTNLTHISTGQLPPGVYFVEFRSAGQVHTCKFIKS